MRLEEHKGLHLAGGPAAAHSGDRLRPLEAGVVIEVLKAIEERRLLTLKLDLQPDEVGSRSRLRSSRPSIPNPALRVIGWTAG